MKGGGNYQGDQGLVALVGRAYSWIWGLWRGFCGVNL